MGKEVVTLEVDSELMERLRAVGIEPAEDLQRWLRREAVLRETPAEREKRGLAWRQEHQAELDAYDRIIAEHGVWCDDVRPF